jgi:glycosyltransferase involved in cell wall biosynthesis
LSGEQTARPELTLVAAADTARIAFVGTYPPRRCGIATFTQDVSRAVGALVRHAPPVIVAVSDEAAQYEYPAEVGYEIRQGVKGDYTRAAEFLNYSDVGLVSVQHEHGIFGGDDGAYILDFVAALRIPAMATLHTVLKTPSESQRALVQTLAQRCARVVVMSRIAADLLARAYGVEGDKVAVIPHGIPAMEPRDQRALKATFGVAGRPVLLTFGLLGPNKGIETVIGALPEVVKAFPDVAYFVVGATHPTIVRHHGEAYRTTLERQAERLRVREHVVFRDQFVTTEELCRYLQAADIFISPYLNEAQVTSGALSYAMGAGAAAVSTPYWHAQELLADGRGRLFPFGDARALGKLLVTLLGDPAEVGRMRAAAHELTRSMVWPRVGATYLRLAEEILGELRLHRALPRPRPASSLPELRLDHLRRLTDDTGIIQHATFTVPARSSGYCVDDNARALIVALEADRLTSTGTTRRLLNTYLGYLQLAQTEDGSFRNFMTYQRTFASDAPPGVESDDCQGRALWAMGACLHLAADEGHRQLARLMFARALPLARTLGPRGTASAMLGLCNYLAAHGGDGQARETLEALASRLVERYRTTATSEWHWFEPELTYDNALIPLALFRAYGVTGDRGSLRVAREALEFLEEVCFVDGQLVLVGNAGWHRRGGVKSQTDEQAVDAAAFVLAFRGAYQATRDHHYLARMRESFAWFLGGNRLGLPLYDFATAGCRDGLGATAQNENEGAESTISFLLSLLEMLELAGEGLEHPES